MRISTCLLASCFSTLFFATGCSDDEGPLPDAGLNPNTEVRFQGIFAGPNGESGVLELVVLKKPAVSGALQPDDLVPLGVVRGTLRLSSLLGEITLSGAVDASGANVTFGGTVTSALGTFSCSGQLVNDAIRGTCTGADGVERYFDSALLGVAPILRYCGGFGGALSGTFNVFSSGGYAAAVFSTPTLRGAAAGTRTGDAIALSIAPAGSVEATVSGDDLSGTWTVPGLGSGTFDGSRDLCPTGSGPRPDAGPTSDAAIVGPDAATPDAAADAGSFDTGLPGEDAGLGDLGPGVDTGQSSVGCPVGGRINYLGDMDDVQFLVATSSGTLFYKSYDTQVGTGFNQIQQINRDGTGAGLFFESPNGAILSLTANDEFVCWGDGTMQESTNSSVVCRPVLGGPFMIITNTAEAPDHVAIANGYVYWTEYWTATIHRAPIANTPPTELVLSVSAAAPGAGAISQLAVNSSHLFFASQANNLGRPWIIPARPLDPLEMATPLGVESEMIVGAAMNDDYVVWLREAPGNLQLPGTVQVHDFSGAFSGIVYDYLNEGGGVNLRGDTFYFSDTTGLAKMQSGQAPPPTAVPAVGTAIVPGGVKPLALDDECVYYFATNQGRGLFGVAR